MRHTWYWDVTIGTDSDAAHYVLDGATIRYGRRVWNEQPDPPTCRITLLAADSGTPQLHAPVSIGFALDAYVDPYTDPYASASGTRFTGRIVAITYEPGLYVIEAVGNTEKVNRAFVGDTPWPTESETARLDRILGLTGVPHRIDGQTRVHFLPRDVDRRNAGELARNYATWGQGMLTEDRDGTVVYLTAERLSKPPRAVTASPGIVLIDGWRSTLDTGDIVNRVSVSYGPTPQGGEQPAHESPHQASIAAFGDRYERVTTELAELADAQEFAAAYLGNRAMPAWQLPSVTVQVDLQPNASVTDLVTLNAGDLLRIPGAPSGSPFPTFLGRVQGWVETIGHASWAITYDLARGDLIPLGTVTWDEPPTPYTWAGQTVTWDQAVTLANLTAA